MKNIGKTKKKLLITATFAFLCAPLLFATNVEEVSAENKQSSNLIIRSFDSSNGLATSEANTVLAANDGHIWIGSYGGLLRYDGKDFINYSKSEEFGISAIKYLCEDDNGVIYIATNENELYAFENDKFTRIVTSDNKSIPTATVLTKDKDNVIYAGCYGAVYAISNKVATLVESSHISGTVYSLSVDKNNVVWGCDGNGSLFGLKDKKEFFFKQANEIPNFDSGESIYSVLPGDNTLYLGTSNSKVITLSLDNVNKSVNDTASNAYSTGSLYSINRLALDKDNNLWLAAGNGCGYLDKNRALVTHDELKAITKANDISIDYQNNVWFASQRNGVYEAVYGSYYHIVNINELKNEQVNTVVYRDGKYFIGTETGLIVTDSNFAKLETAEALALTNEFNGKRIRNLNLDEDGRIWVSSNLNNKQVAWINNDLSLEKATFLNEYGYINMRLTLELSNENIALGTTSGLLIISHDGSTLLNKYDNLQGLDNAFILTMCETSNGELLIGTDGGGLFKLKDGVISKVLKNDGTALTAVLKCYEDQDTVWVSSSKYLYMLKNDELIQVNIKAYCSESILGIYSVSNKLCILQSNGIYCFNRDEIKNNVISHCTVFDSKQGLVGDISSNSFSLLKDGYLYVCSTKGLSYIDLAIEKHIPPLPKISVVKITYELNEKDYEITSNFENIDIPKNAKKIRIQISCLNYSLEDAYICYKLNGFDTNPTTILGKGISEISYSSLPGGTYNFVMFLKDQQEDEGITISFALNKEYKWGEKSINIVLVIAGGAIVIAAIAFIIARRRIKQIEKDKQKYKEITNEALNTIANTIDAKDEYTNGHSQRVAQYSVAIGKRLGMSDEELENLHYVALLHDIGKIGVPDAILNKPGKLTDEEYEAIQKHTVIGGKILHDFKMIDNISQGAVGHHERYDGKGYPNHKVGEENPLIARIISVADTYDAMSSTRPYRTSRTPEFCIEQLEQGKGSQFDPKLADIMIEIIKENKEK